MNAKLAPVPMVRVLPAILVTCVALALVVVSVVTAKAERLASVELRAAIAGGVMFGVGFAIGRWARRAAGTTYRAPPLSPLATGATMGVAAWVWALLA